MSASESRLMSVRQWEIWKTRPTGFEQDHGFVIVNGQERLENPLFSTINGLACFTLRGGLLPMEVRLNGADGFQTATTCQSDLIYFLEKSKLHSPLGFVSWERQQQIKFKIKQILRL
jgi:hypothetical protein